MFTRKSDMPSKVGHIRGGPYIKDVVFGINDGIVTIVAFLAGLQGAHLETRLVILASLAVIFSGAISMALGDYISTKSQQRYFHREVELEKKHIKELTDLELKEVEEYFKTKGATEEELQNLKKMFERNHDMLLEFMMKHEFGMPHEEDLNPIKASIIMGIFYTVAGFIPLFPFLLGIDLMLTLIIAGVISVGELFIAGVLRTLVTGEGKIMGGLETMIIGIIAIILGYLAGVIIDVLI